MIVFPHSLFSHFSLSLGARQGPPLSRFSQATAPRPSSPPKTPPPSSPPSPSLSPRYTVGSAGSGSCCCRTTCLCWWRGGRAASWRARRCGLGRVGVVCGMGCGQCSMWWVLSVEWGVASVARGGCGWWNGVWPLLYDGCGLCNIGVVSVVCGGCGLYTYILIHVCCI